MASFPAAALSSRPSAAQLKLLRALVCKYPQALQKGAYEELTGFSREHVHNLLRSLMDKAWAFRYDRPDHGRYYYFPNTGRIADILGIPPVDTVRVALAAERDQFIANVKADLAGLAQRKSDREAAARQATAAKAAKQAAQSAQAAANADEFERVTREVATAVECETSEPGAELGVRYEYSWCDAGGIVSRLDEDGDIFIGIIERV